MFKKPKRVVKRIFIHCSASDNPAHNDIEVIRRWHTAPIPRGNGWRDVGYHYFITTLGKRQEGRDLELTPAAQRGHNKYTIAICVHGLTKFSPQSLHELKRLCLEIDREYDSQVTFHGHCEVSKKSCPVFDYKAVLNLDDNGYIKYEREPLTINPIPVIKSINRVKPKTLWQKFLNLFKSL